MKRSTRPRILLVDDEPDLSEALAAILERSGMDARTAESGAGMREAMRGWTPDAVVLDLHLRGESGLDLADWLLANAPPAGPPAIVFLTGSGDAVDRIIGLEIGADDYIRKPVPPRELVARLRALLVRLGRPSGRGRVIVLGTVAVDADLQIVLDRDGGETPLTPSEFALLKCFLDEPDRVFDRDDLLSRAPASDEDVNDRSIDRRIGRLRRKLRADDDDPLIETVRGQGYRLTAGALARIRGEG